MIETLAIFNLSGNTPVLKIKLHMCESGRLIYCETAFNGSAFIPSTPAAELLGKFMMKECTSDSSVGARKIDFVD